MALRPIPAIASDFAGVLLLFQERGIVSNNPPQALINVASSIHRGTYSLILWKFRLRGLPEHSRVFTDEIASDALQILPQVMMGYGKTAKLLIRGIIENCLRHVFFSDHPIEFQRMNVETKWYLSVEELFEYARHHPDFVRTEKHFDALNRLSTLYSLLSADIHGRAVRNLEMRTALEEIGYNAVAAAGDADLVRRCSEAVNFLLAIFHRLRMDRFQKDDQRIILQTLPANARTLWKQFE